MKVTTSLLLIGLLLASSVIGAPARTGTATTSAQALQSLKDGNQRFVSGNMIFPHQDAQRLEAIRADQHPFATILSCSDSRVPLELVFDAGFGDLFAVRVAGNVCGPDEMASIEYAVSHLNTPVLLVLGHTKCGAVTAAVTGGPTEGALPSLMQRIMPAVQSAQTKHPQLQGKDLVNDAVAENVWQSVSDLLKHSEVVRSQVSQGKLKVIGGVYNIDSYQVQWLGSHPNQAQLLEAPAAPAAEPQPQPTAAVTPQEQKPATKAPDAVPAQTAQPDPLAAAVEKLETTVKSINQPAAAPKPAPVQAPQPQTAQPPATADQAQFAALLKEVEQLKAQIAELKQTKPGGVNDAVLAGILSDIESLKAENATLRTQSEKASQKLASLDDNTYVPSDNAGTQKLVALVNDLNTSLEKAKANSKPATPAPAINKGNISLIGFIQEQYYNKAGGTGVSSFESKRARLGVSGVINSYAKIDIMGEFSKTPKLLDAFVTLTPLKGWSLRVGQIRPPSGVELGRSVLTLPFVNYSFIQAINTDRDMGASLAYERAITKNLAVTTACGLVNGSGINASDSNTTKNFASRIDVKLVNQLTLSANSYTGKTNNALSPKNMDIYGASASWTWKTEMIDAEYVHSKVAGLKKAAWYVWGGHTFKTNLKLLPEIQLSTRYEQLDPNRSVMGDRQTRLTVGTNLFVDKKFTLIALNYVMNGEQTTHVNNNEFLANFQVSF